MFMYLRVEVMVCVTVHLCTPLDCTGHNFTRSPHNHHSHTKMLSDTHTGLLMLMNRPRLMRFFAAADNGSHNGFVASIPKPIWTYKVVAFENIASSFFLLKTY